MPDVAELIGHALQLGVVVSDGHVTMLESAQLRLEVHRALEFVVPEETLNGMPKREGVGAVMAYDVEDTFGHNGEDPVDDAGVDHVPFAVAICRGCWRTDMAEEAKFTECGIKETSPLPVVALLHVEDD
jgi:hypothetical protein